MKDISEVEIIVKRFKDSVLTDEDHFHKCFTLCYPLSLYLNINDIHNSILSGNIKCTPHYILRLNDEKDTFIDPTIRQFYEKMSDVFIGYRQEYSAFKEIENFDCVYEYWIHPLLNDGLLMQPTFIVKQNRIDIKILLKINIKAYMLLYNEINHLNLHGKINISEIHKKYFDGIHTTVMHYSERKKDLIEEKLLNDFDEILKIARAAQFNM